MSFHLQTSLYNGLYLEVILTLRLTGKFSQMICSEIMSGLVLFMIRTVFHGHNHDDYYFISKTVIPTAQKKKKV